MGKHVPYVRTEQVLESLVFQPVRLCSSDNTVSRNDELLVITLMLGVHGYVIAAVVGRDDNHLYDLCITDILMTVLIRIERLTGLQKHVGQEVRLGENLIHDLPKVIALCLLSAIGPGYTVIAVLSGITDHTLHGKLLPVLLERSGGNEILAPLTELVTRLSGGVKTGKESVKLLFLFPGHILMPGTAVFGRHL